jgi:electron transport complex protein RnfD
MNSNDPRLLLQAAPLLKQQLTTRRAMLDVLLALLPATLAALWFFGLSALLVLGACIGGSIITEWLFTPADDRREHLLDGSGFLTGLLLGLTLPPSLPLWMAFVGGAVSIGLGKLIWGGLGQNLFNPALVGRAFLLATFPTAMTTWTPAGGPGSFFQVHASNLAMPFMHVDYDGVSSATPLGLMKFEYQGTSLSNLLLGNISGCIGETSALLLLLGGAYMLWRRVIDWRVPASILLSVAALSAVFYLASPDKYPGPFFSIFSGGLLIGAFFMATDPVSSPITPRGAWIFGVAIGLLVVLIRLFGGFPEGVMYAILLMNAATPLIDRYTQPRVFGRGGGSG